MTTLSLATLYQAPGDIVAPQRENLYPASELTVHDSYQTDQTSFSHATYRVHPREPSAAQLLYVWRQVDMEARSTQEKDAKQVRQHVVAV